MLIITVPRGKMKTKTTKKCANCKKVFNIHRTTDKYCSPVCAKESAKKEGKRLTRKVRSIRKGLMDEWARKVKERAGNKCEYCGKTENLNSHHIFSRSNQSTRYELINGICLCSGCHVLSSKFSAHKTPAEFIEFLKEYRGLETYELLRQKAKSIYQVKENHVNQ